MAAIFDFNGSGRLGRGRGINLYQGGGRRSKIRKGVGERNKRFVSLKLKYLKKMNCTISSAVFAKNIYLEALC